MAKATSIIFYSWQSDIKQNRGFIEDALKNAVKSLTNDDSLAVEPVVDRDTSGVPGSPEIARTIFNKIKGADIFVCDVTIINQGEKRLTPNPNVVGEWGFALAELKEERIIMVMNTAYGKHYNGPRNLDMKRDENKIYSRHDEKTVYGSFQSKSRSGTLERREDPGTNCLRA